MERSIVISDGAKEIIESKRGRKVLGKLEKDIKETSPRYVFWTIIDEKEYLEKENKFRRMGIGRCSVAEEVGKSKKFLFAVGVEQREVKN